MCSQTSALTQTKLVERHFLLVPAKVQMDSMVDKERKKSFLLYFLSANAGKTTRGENFHSGLFELYGFFSLPKLEHI